MCIIPFNPYNPAIKWVLSSSDEKMYFKSSILSFFCGFSQVLHVFQSLSVSVLHSAVISSFPFQDVIFLPLCSYGLSFHFIMLSCFIKSMHLIKFLKSIKQFQYKHFYCLLEYENPQMLIYVLQLITIFLFFGYKIFIFV